MPEPEYRSYWQRLLKEEAERNTASGGGGDNAGSAPQPEPRLVYDWSEINAQSPQVTNHGDYYQDSDIVVTAPRQGGYPARTVLAQCDGRVMRGMTGWQNPDRHHGAGAGMGWRTWIQCADGSRIGYGHMDPSTTLPGSTVVSRGDPVGRYSNPTNGNSSAAHVHVQQYDVRNRLVRPTNGSPLTRPGHQGSTYGQVDHWHPRPHMGDDWSEN